jgi:hypothetical protein
LSIYGVTMVRFGRATVKGNLRNAASDCGSFAARGQRVKFEPSTSVEHAARLSGRDLQALKPTRHTSDKELW